MTLWQSLLTIAGLVVITLLTRGFFILPEREPPIPEWLRESLRYAPIGALVAVVAPDLVMTQGHVIDTLRDARLVGAAAALACFLWRRDMLATIVAGTGAMLVMRLAFGW